MFSRLSFLLFVPLLFISAGAQIQVVDVSPRSQQLDTPMNPEISIMFDRGINPGDITPQTFKVFGRWTGVINGIWSFAENNQKVVFQPQTPFNAGEMVTVMLAKGIGAANGDTLEKGYAWQFWIKPNRTTLKMNEIQRIAVRRPGEGHVQTYGAHAADVNGDGYTDYMVPNEVSNDVRMFLNDGTGQYSNFTVHPLTGAARPSTNESGDFNNDGFVDFMVGSTQNNRVHVLLGDGSGGFSAINSLTAGTGVRGLTLLDVNGDAEFDAVTANRNANNLSLFIGNGNGGFADAITISTSLFQETGIFSADANNDGILDIFVGAFGGNEIALFLGDGEGNLTLSDRTPLTGSSWMIATGDINGDGFADAVSANSNTNEVAIVRGTGSGGLMPVTTFSLGAPFVIAVDLGDLDGDGDLDLIASSYGSGFESGVWTLYENDGSGNFINPQYFDASEAASCAVFHDRDNDGDLDITGIDEVDDLLFVFENPGISVSVDHPLPSPTRGFALHQNYPNPFNPSTTIAFEIPELAFVKIEIVDINGRLVKQMVNETYAAGLHQLIWNGDDSQNNPVAAGVYFYKLTTKNYIETRKLLLIK